MCGNYIAHDRRVGTPVFGPFQESNAVYRNLIIYLFKVSNFMLYAYIQCRHVVLQFLSESFEGIKSLKIF